jgi:acyl-CoA synthetase (AMP-forming)/AMP-acid ligase II
VVGAHRQPARRLGCKPGDRVAVQTDKVWQVVPLYLACLRAGLVYLPLNTAYQKSELAFFFEDAKPTVIVCRPDMLGVVTTLDRGAKVLMLDANGGEVFDHAAREPDRFETVHSRPDDLAAILYTSGTTGRSKGAMLSHRNLASNAVALVESWSFTGNDILLHALPVFHVHGLFVALHCVLLAGARMLWLPRFDAREVVEQLPMASVMMGVPTFYTRLLSEPSFDRARRRRNPAVRVRIRPAAARDVRCVRGAHGPAHPRALRHDGDRHDHVESARRSTRWRHGRAAVAGRRGPGHRERPTLRARTGRPGRGAWPERLQRVLEPARQDAR